MDYKTFELGNKIRVIHHRCNSPVSYLGLIINTGSRDEDAEEHGLAHFIEHTLFKGTKKRNAYQLISRIENVGGELNAFTTKEEICLYSIFLNEHFERAVELFYDIFSNSSFPEGELNKEKDIIIDEIHSYQDNPADLIFDDFESLLFPNDPLGRDILGQENTIRSFDSKKILQYIRNHFFTDQIAIAVVSSLPETKIKNWVVKYFQQFPVSTGENLRKVSTGYRPVSLNQSKDTNQCHCILGNRAYGAYDKQRYPLLLLNNILGGQSMNSRLNMMLREKKGYSYHVESNYTIYSDCGSVSIYFGTDVEKLERSLKLINNEIKKLQNNTLGILQLSNAKKQLTGQYLIASENYENLLFALGKAYLRDQLDYFHQFIAEINSISALEVMEVANDILDVGKLSRLVYR